MLLRGHPPRGDNLRHAARRASLAEAIELAGCDDLIDRMPDGLATQLGRSFPGGFQLSRGQWQVIALARGLLREEPLVLVLDEPTSSLDLAAEQAFFEAVASARGRRNGGGITLFVTHRFNTVPIADLVIVLERGRVTEHGSHDELMGLGGEYARLVELQARAYRD